MKNQINKNKAIKAIKSENKRTILIIHIWMKIINRRKLRNMTARVRKKTGFLRALMMKTKQRMRLELVKIY